MKYGKLQFLIKKDLKKFQLYFFLLQVLIIKTLDSLEMLDPDPYPDSMNPDH
jgi:hypothetical protein